jgi:hypothetical protein
MKTKLLLTTLAAALAFMAGACAEPATIYGVLKRNHATGIDVPSGDFTWYTIVNERHPFIVEMESYAHEGLIRVITPEIQILADPLDESLVGTLVRVHGETWAPHTMSHQTPVMLTADSIRPAAPLAPRDSNERGLGKRIPYDGTIIRPDGTEIYYKVTPGGTWVYTDRDGKPLKRQPASIEEAYTGGKGAAEPKPAEGIDYSQEPGLPVEWKDYTIQE